jgi:hypothetical protein
MIRPLRRCTMGGRKRCVSAVSAVMLRSIWPRISSSGICANSPKAPKPALLMRMSMAMPSRWSWSKRNLGAGRSARSRAMVFTVTPCDCSSLATCARLSALRATSTRLWWSRAKSLASSYPMPPEAPVMRAVVADMVVSPGLGLIPAANDRRQAAISELGRTSA